MTELNTIVRSYNASLDNKDLDEQKKQTFLTMVIDIKKDFEKQIEQIEKNNLLLDELYKTISKIRVVLKAITQKDRVVYFE